MKFLVRQYLYSDPRLRLIWRFAVQIIPCPVGTLCTLCFPVLSFICMWPIMPFTSHRHFFRYCFLIFTCYIEARQCPFVISVRVFIFPWYKVKIQQGLLLFDRMGMSQRSIIISCFVLMWLQALPQVAQTDENYVSFHFCWLYSCQRSGKRRKPNG